MFRSKEKAAREAAEAKKKVKAGNASLYAACACGMQLMILSWEEDGDEAKKHAIVALHQKGNGEEYWDL